MVLLGILLLATARTSSHQTYHVQVAPFTHASIADSERLEIGTTEPQTEMVHLKGLKLNPAEGMIEVWIKPEWAGDDGRNHQLWTTGRAGGRELLLEKSDLGMLRAVLRTPTGQTVSRTDVTSWKPGDWHHVVVGWTSHNGMTVGLPLWVDKVCVDGQITSHGVFNPVAMPNTITLSDAKFSELIVRPKLDAEGRYGMVACVYRDFFRTAPYSGIKIDKDPGRVPSDPRVVAGQPKQFGLLAGNQGKWEPLVENVVRYSQWAYFDARQMIQWSTSDPSVATVDKKGRVTGVKPGKCLLRAEFRDMKASYPIDVISADKPDLDAIGIELLPRYRADAVKNKILPGELVSARVRIGNYGLAPIGAGVKVRLSLIRRREHEFRHAPNDKPLEVFEQKLPALAPAQETVLTFAWPYPKESTWMKLELDPEKHLDELCKVNNTIEELMDARPVHLGYSPLNKQDEFAKHELNHVGSFSYYDWMRAEKNRMDVMLQEAVYQTTGPNGVEEAYRIDRVTALEHGQWEDEPFIKEAGEFDGGFPINEKVDLMSIDCAIIHEFGHAILSQPDLYGYGTAARNVLITDESGKPVAGTPLLPILEGDANLQYAPATNGPCGVGDRSLMDGCQLWLPPSMAGHIMYYRGYRPDRFWGTQGRLVPTRANRLLITDAYDQPLKNAAVYVYHVSQAPVQDSEAKYFADRPKFLGPTDNEGRFLFPNQTDDQWDDPKTDVVEGAKSVWNPFGTATTDTAFTPNVWEVEGLLLIRVVSGTQSEYRFMDLTQFNDEFLAGHVAQGSYTLRTSLEPSSTPTPIVRKPIPEAIKSVNKAPVAVVVPSEFTVKCGEEFTMDGSKSYDPEGQPLIYRWNVGEGWLKGSLSQSSTLKVKAPSTPQELSYKFWVIDGIRCSEAVVIKVKVVKPN